MVQGSPPDLRATGLEALYTYLPGVFFYLAVLPGGDYRFDWVSERFLVDTGMRRDEVIGRSPRQVVPAASQPLSFAKFAEAVESGKEVRWEDRVLFPSGLRVGEVAVAPVFDGHGRCTYLVGLVHDGTDRKRAPPEWTETEQKFRLLIEATGNGFLILDADGRVTDANQEYVRLSGHQRLGEIVGRSVLEWTATEDLERNAAALTRCLAEGKVEQLQIHYRGPAGISVPIEIEAKVLHRPQGLQILALCREISARKKLEEALVGSERRLAQLVHNSPVVIYTCRPEPPFVATFISQNVRALFGFEPESLLHDSRLWVDSVHPDDAARLIESTRQLNPAGTTVSEYRIHCPDGRWCWVRDEHKVVRSENGQPVELIGCVLDISERKNAELALAAAERQKDEFLAMLSHELRNPLTPIRHSVELLLRNRGLDGQALHAAAVIDRQAKQLVRLIDDLLDVTRISRGKILLQRKNVDLAALVRQTVEDQEGMLAALKVVLRLPSTPVWVNGDETRLAQVIGNLLNNAAKFTASGGTLTLTVSAKGPLATLEVSDTGIGIEPGMIERIFDSFAQADRSLERTRGGLGLGLALVKSLVEQHGGTVEARSGGPGRGASFLVTLARLELQSKPVASLAAAVHAEIRKVLIIEDNVDAAESLKALLELDGHLVEMAFSGPEGVDKAVAFQPDIVLCDIGLPGMDGYAVASALRQNPRLKLAQLVALTGYAQPEDRRRALHAGFDAHLAKPPRLDLLEQLLSHPSA